MKIFFIILSTVVLGVTYSERVRRQIWPAPGNPFWKGPGNDREFFDNGFWMGPPRFDQPVRFDQPSRNQNGFRDDFNSGNDWNIENGFRDEFNSRNDRNQEDFKPIRNQNRRTSTEISGPLTTTPRTIHVAPQGCTCPMTQQFNPVCGTDGNTYRNKGLLNCYQRCGTNVSQKRLGTC